MPYRVAFRGSAGLWALSPRFETAAEAEGYAATLRAHQKRVVEVPPGPAGGSTAGPEAAPPAAGAGAGLDQSRLLFARYLVATGRLSG
jgi:hypothetical protein